MLFAPCDDSLVIGVRCRLLFVHFFATDKFEPNGRQSLNKSCAIQRKLKQPSRLVTPLALALTIERRCLK